MVETTLCASRAKTSTERRSMEATARTIVLLAIVFVLSAYNIAAALIGGTTSLRGCTSGFSPQSLQQRMQAAPVASWT
jgi:hypothetical protein